MYQFKVFSLNWWILHVIAISFYFCLGHWVHF